MIVRDVHIPAYGWYARFYFKIRAYHIGDVVYSLEDIDCPEHILRQAVDHMMRDTLNEGFTYSNRSLRRSVVLVGRTSSGKEFVNSFAHELRHLTDDIASEEGMPTSGEEVAYLAGDIAEALGDVVCKMSCDKCRHNT